MSDYYEGLFKVKRTIRSMNKVIKCLLLVLVGISVLGIISSSNDLEKAKDEVRAEEPKQEAVKEKSPKEEYNEFMIAKLNKFAEGTDEIDKILCYNGDCSVIDFYWNDLPGWDQTLESFIKSQTWMASKTRQQMTAVSPVTVSAVLSERLVYVCSVWCDWKEEYQEDCAYMNEFDYLNEL